MGREAKARMLGVLYLGRRREDVDEGVLGSWKMRAVVCCRLGKSTALGGLGWKGRAGLGSRAVGQPSSPDLSPTS